MDYARLRQHLDSPLTVRVQPFDARHPDWHRPDVPEAAADPKSFAAALSVSAPFDRMFFAAFTAAELIEPMWRDLLDDLPPDARLDYPPQATLPDTVFTLLAAVRPALDDVPVAGLADHVETAEAASGFTADLWFDAHIHWPRDEVARIQERIRLADGAATAAMHCVRVLASRDDPDRLAAEFRACIQQMRFVSEACQRRWLHVYLCRAATRPSSVE